MERAVIFRARLGEPCWTVRPPRQGPVITLTTTPPAHGAAIDPGRHAPTVEIRTKSDAVDVITPGGACVHLEPGDSLEVETAPRVDDRR
jgi:hypothetical protein